LIRIGGGGGALCVCHVRPQEARGMIFESRHEGIVELILYLRTTAALARCEIDEGTESQPVAKLVQRRLDQVDAT